MTVVLDMIKGDLTITEIIAKYQVSKSMEKQLLDHGSEIFDSGKSQNSNAN